MWMVYVGVVSGMSTYGIVVICGSNVCGISGVDIRMIFEYVWMLYGVIHIIYAMVCCLCVCWYMKVKCN